MMALHGAWDNETAWIYLATHGTYGVLWVLKSRVFPDAQWERETGLAYGLVIWGGLTLYWIAPWLITAGDLHAPAWLLGACVAVYAVGVLLHFASDMQKHVHLTLQPGRLFTGGLWSRCRNPNYLGELLIYGGFSALAMSWIPFAALTVFALGVWLPNMLRKDRSLARYPGFAAWKRRSALLIPGVL